MSREGSPTKAIAVDDWPVVSPPSAAPVRIAFVIKAFVGRAGGAEKVLCNTANAMAQAGAKVTIFHSDPPGQAFFPLEPSIDLMSIRPKSGPVPQTGSAPDGRPTGRAMRRYRFPVNLWTWWKQHGWHVRTLRRFLIAHRPDVVIAFQPSATTDTLIAALGTGIPVVASLHNVPDQDLRRWERWDANPVDRILRRWMLRTASRVTVLLPEFVHQLPARVRSRAVVVPNAIHVEGALAAPGENDASGNVIIAVGRLAPAKDHATLIDAWAHLHARFPQWRVEVLGHGPLRKALAQRIRDRGVEKSFRLLGESDSVMTAYAHAKIFCMPSLFEGFGLVTAEALAKGLPAVGFLDCPGTNSLISHEVDGLLVDPSAHAGDRARALAAALERLINDSVLRGSLGAAGPQRMQRYLPEVVAANWLSLINPLVGKQISRQTKSP